MAAPVNSSGSFNPRLKPKKPLDVWSTREKLCLASAVFKIGDQNWVSVSRAIKPYAEPGRPPEWFHQRNCLLQYYDLMEQQEPPNRRKRGGDKSESDTPSLQIMRKMTIERSEQLKTEILEMQQSFRQIKSELESIKAGLWDDRIQNVWQEIQEEQKKAEAEQAQELEIADEDDDIKPTELSDMSVQMADIEDYTPDSVGELSVPGGDDDSESSSLASSASQTLETSTVDMKLSSESHLFKLLKSDVTTAAELQRLKSEQEQVPQNEGVDEQADLPPQHSVAQDDNNLTTLPGLCRAVATTTKGQPELTKVLSTGDCSTAASSVGHIQRSNKTDASAKSTTQESAAAEVEASDNKEICHTSKDKSRPDASQEIPVLNTETTQPAQSIHGLSTTTELKGLPEVRDIKQEPPAVATLNSDPETTSTVKITEVEKVDQQGETPGRLGHLSGEMELNDSAGVKEEPLSPSSSISSKMSDAGSKKGRGRGRPRNSGSLAASVRKLCQSDDDKKDDRGSSRLSDQELSDDDRESDDLLASQMVSINPSSVLSESFPNSPASLSICSDTEEEKSFKQWKKSIMLVWRAAATHKYANVFLHPVTDEIAPGYHSVVHRSMDLSTIKKNVETGVIRSTLDFQHDMMLMFTNAIMYNSSDHNVFKMAKEMYDDVMQHIEMMIQTSDAKNLRQSKRTDTSDKEDDGKKRKLSVDQSDGGGGGVGSTKKRKTKTEDSHS